MVKLLEQSEIDPEVAALDEVMTAGEEAQELASFTSDSGEVGDLSDGGRVGRATLYPTRAGKRIMRGRAVARRAWMWDGTESVLPLAWNPEGLKSDEGRAYLRKRHCLCCGDSGFKGQCPRCVRGNCSGCAGGTDKKKNIRNFYFNKEEVPFPQKFYGSINCFHPLCIRREGKGFKTEEDMRLHARSRHRMEYASHMETLAERRNTETADLRKELADLRGLIFASAIGGSKVDAGSAVGTAEAPLYVSDKPKATRRRKTPLQ